MKKYKNGIRLLACVLYIIGLLIIGFYVVKDLDAGTVISPVGRLVLLISGCAWIYFGSILFAKTTARPAARRIMNVTVWLFFLIYVILLGTFTLFDEMFGRDITNIFTDSRYMRMHYMSNQLNLIPFKTVFAYISGMLSGTFPFRTVMINIAGNIVAFAPFAFFVPLLFKRINTLCRFILYMTAVIVFVELLQFVTMSGSCDIDDLMLNLSGAILCYSFLQMNFMKRILNKMTLGVLLTNGG